MDKGFGDTFERFTIATGIHWLIMYLSEKTGIPCGCKERKEQPVKKLNIQKSLLFQMKPEKEVLDFQKKVD